jgi:hypothetical protein
MADPSLPTNYHSEPDISDQYIDIQSWTKNRILVEDHIIQTLTPPPDFLTYPTQRFILINSLYQTLGKAVTIQNLNGSLIEVYSGSFKDAVYIQVDFWWKPSLINSKILYSGTPVFVAAPGQSAVLKIQATVPKTHSRGFLGAILMYLPEDETQEAIKVLVARDHLAGQIEVSIPDVQWAPGRYILTAQRFSTANSVPLEADSIEWNLNLPTNILSSGYPGDITDSLVLE